MEHFREFEKEENQNWLKGVVALLCLRKPLKRFIDEEIGIFYQELVDKCGADLCVKNCNFNNWKPQRNQSPPLCEVCASWRDSILDNHTNPGGKVMWKNSKPDRWSQDKWEVAKVYMPDGHKNHNSIGEFDIAALLCLMRQCKHFKKFELGGSCENVSSVRNNIMHSPSFKLKQEDMLDYFNRIRMLGEVLEKHHPEFKSLSKDIDEIKNLDCRLTFPDDMAAQKSRAQDETELEDILFAVGNLAAEQHLTRMRLEKLERQIAQQEQENMPLVRMSSADKAKFVDDNKAMLIQNVTMVMPIAEELGEDMVHPETYELIRATLIRQDKMRVLYQNALHSGGEEVKAAFYDALKKHQPRLVERISSC